MSEEFHRPTYTFPNGTYNATEVRLYGKPGIIQSPGEAHVNGQDYTIHVNVAKKADKKAKAAKLAEGLMTKAKSFDWGLPEFGIRFTSVCLLDTLDHDHLIMFASATITSNGKDLEGTRSSWGVIYGYAYEGHCYDLPKPKVMLLPVQPQALPPNDAGYYEKRDAGYKVWVVDKLEKCLEVEVNQGFVEQIVLEANLPGRRSPTMYASKNDDGPPQRKAERLKQP